MTDKKTIWAVLDVDPQIRKKARSLARAEKKNIGKWLSEVIVNQENKNAVTSTQGAEDMRRDLYPTRESISLLNLKIEELRIELADVLIKLNNLPKKSFLSKFL